MVVITFVLNAPPSSFEAARISFASLFAMLRSLRLRAYPINHFIARLFFRSSRTACGIWKLAPPTRRLRTSTDGAMLISALAGETTLAAMFVESVAIASPNMATTAAMGRKRSGAKSPDRSSSYSRKKPSTSSSLNSISATGS